MKNLFKIIMMIGLTVNLFGNTNNEIIIQTVSYHTEKTYEEETRHGITGEFLFSENTEYRNENYGIYYQRKINDYLKIGIGGYQNSVYRNSYALGFELYKEFDNFEIGVTTGLVTGYKTGFIYDKTDVALNPMLSVNASYKINDTFNVKLVTVLLPDNGFVFTPQLVIKF